MTWKTIEKPKQGWGVVPNLLDYEKTRAGFSWEAARHELDGLPGGRGLNIAHEAVDRHATVTCAYLFASATERQVVAV